MPLQQLIQIQPDASAKPAVGAACNGCGVCCLAESCPVGIVLSRSRLGPCKALRWNADERQYQCGALLDARAHAAAGAFAALRARLLARWIAAGTGCDCTLDVATSRTIGQPDLIAVEPHD